MDPDVMLEQAACVDESLTRVGDVAVLTFGWRWTFRESHGTR